MLKICRLWVQGFNVVRQAKIKRKGKTGMLILTRRIDESVMIGDDI